MQKKVEKIIEEKQKITLNDLQLGSTLDPSGSSKPMNITAHRGIQTKYSSPISFILEN